MLVSVDISTTNTSSFLRAEVTVSWCYEAIGVGALVKGVIDSGTQSFAHGSIGERNFEKKVRLFSESMIGMGSIDRKY